MSSVCNRSRHWGSFSLERLLAMDLLYVHSIHLYFTSWTSGWVIPSRKSANGCPGDGHYSGIFTSQDASQEAIWCIPSDRLDVGDKCHYFPECANWFPSSGIILIALSSISVSVALVCGGVNYKWTSWRIILPLVLGGAGFICLILYEVFLVKYPLVRLDKSFLKSLIFTLICRSQFKSWRTEQH